MINAYKIVLIKIIPTETSTVFHNIKAINAQQTPSEADMKFRDRRSSVCCCCAGSTLLRTGLFAQNAMGPVRRSAEEDSPGAKEAAHAAPAVLQLDSLHLPLLLAEMILSGKGKAVSDRFVLILFWPFMQMTN